MPAKKTPLTDRLEALRSAVPAARQRQRECDLALRRVAGEIAQLTDAVKDAYADGDEARAAKASKARAELETGGLREAEERLEGAKRAVSRAEVEIGTFAASNLAGLLDERVEQAASVARAAEDAVEQLAQAHAAWTAVYADVAKLRQLAGHRDTRDMPDFPGPLADLVREARRMDGVRVPLPLPGHQVVARPAEIPANLPVKAGDGSSAVRDAA